MIKFLLRKLDIFAIEIILHHLPKKHVAEVFSSVLVEMDGHEYIDCEFRECTIRYCGRTSFVLMGCNLEDCTYLFDGPAGNTLDMLVKMAHPSNSGGRPLIKQLLNL